MRWWLLVAALTAAVAGAERAPVSAQLLRLHGGQQSASSSLDSEAAPTRPSARGRGRSSRGRGARGRGRGRGPRRQVPLPREAVDPKRSDIALFGFSDTRTLTAALVRLGSWEDPVASGTTFILGNVVFAAALLSPWSMPTALGTAVWWLVLLGAALRLATKASLVFGGPDLAGRADEIVGALPAIGAVARGNAPLLPAKEVAVAFNMAVALLNQAAEAVRLAATASSAKRTAVVLLIAFALRRLGRLLPTLPMAYAAFCLGFAVQPARLQALSLLHKYAPGIEETFVDLKEQAIEQTALIAERVRTATSGTAEVARAAVGSLRQTLEEGFSLEAVLKAFGGAGGGTAASVAQEEEEEDDDNEEDEEAEEAEQEQEQEEEAAAEEEDDDDNE